MERNIIVVYLHIVILSKHVYSHININTDYIDLIKLHYSHIGKWEVYLHSDRVGEELSAYYS